MKGNYKIIKGAVESAAIATAGDRFPAVEFHQVEGGAVELRTTDAYRMHLVTIPAGVIEFDASDTLPIRIETKSLVQALKACKAAESVEIVASGDTFTVSGGGVSATAQGYAGVDIPNPSMFAGEYTAPAGIQFNALYMADIGKAANVIGNPKSLNTVMFDGTKGGDINTVSRWSFINPTSGVSLAVYLMPVKGVK